MARIQTVDPATAEGKVAGQLEIVKKKMGRVPNIMATMANSATTLGAYLGLTSAIADSKISMKLREQIALHIGQVNDCQYCLAAHTVIGKMNGLGDEEMLACRKGKSSDPKVEAALTFVRRVQETNGYVSDAELAAVRDAGFSDGEILDMIALLTLNLYTNLLNHVADTEIDFPAAPELS